MTTILIIDNHRPHREYLASLLQNWNHRLLQAANGAEGFAVASAEVPDFVIADIPMSNPDGAEFVRRLRAHPALASIPVIFCTDPYRADLDRAVSERKRAEEALRKSADGLQNLTRRLLEVQEEERRHLARELHDEIGQVLATITLHLHTARRQTGAGAETGLDECAALLQQAGEQVRSLALELRPTMLDVLGLEATLRWLAERHQQRAGSEVQILGHLSGATPSPELAIACFRVVQEALTNVVRHAAARHVWIELSHSDSVLEVVVRDDGMGFDVASTQEEAVRRGRLGLSGMLERVQLLGGTMAVASERGQGTRIRASFPLTEPHDEPAGPVG